MIRRIKKHKKVYGVIALCLIAASVAAAAWLISASGPGRGKIGTLTAPTVSQGTTSPTSNCYPGADCDGYFTINNPNGALIVTAMVTDSGGGTDNGTDCPTSNITAPSQSGLSVPVPPGSTQVVIPNAFHLNSAAPNACQGLNFFKNVTLSFSTP